MEKEEKEKERDKDRDGGRKGTLEKGKEKKQKLGSTLQKENAGPRRIMSQAKGTNYTCRTETLRELHGDGMNI